MHPRLRKTKFKTLNLLVTLSLAACFILPGRVQAKPLVCSTPPSLMLHANFGLIQMRELADAIQANGLQTFTYRQVADLYDQGLCPPENAILVSLDDLGTRWLRLDFKQMIEIFTDRGLTLTVGVVTGVGSQPEENWAYLKEIDALGIEIASHSARHLNPNKVSQDYIRDDVSLSYNTIAEYLGKPPSTYILPGGNGFDNVFLLQQLQTKYRSVVSIHAPNTYSGELLLFRRIPPLEGSQFNLPWYLKNNFPWQFHAKLALPNKPRIRACQPVTE